MMVSDGLPQTSARPGALSTRWFFFFFACVSILGGFEGTLSQDPDFENYPYAWGLALSLGAWAVADADRRGHPIPILSRSWMTCLAMILVPLYLLWSRGWRGLGWLLFHLLAWFVLAYLGALIAWFGVLKR